MEMANLETQIAAGEHSAWTGLNLAIYSNLIGFWAVVSSALASHSGYRKVVENISQYASKA